MDKAYILTEIKRTAATNSGVPLGRARFRAETGIVDADWAKFWVRWNDAVREAGLAPNRLQPAYDENYLLEAFTDLVRELGHFPVSGEVRMKARKALDFPSHNTFRRFGGKHTLAARVLRFCQEHEGYDDVAAICEPLASAATEQADRRPAASGPMLGSVYLLRAGRHYKIGRSNAVGRRERELAIQLPEKTKLVHSIKTDDPAGIEAYWHRRFEARRGNGEWFALTPEDVSAFRRRKFM